MSSPVVRHTRSLELRLVEAEATIEALLAGEIDAVADRTSHTPVLVAKVQSELQRSQKRLRDLIDGIGPTMFVGLLTPEGLVVEANRSALEAAGLQPEDVLGKPFEDSGWWAYSSQARERLRETIARAARGEASRYDTQVAGADGSLIDVDFSMQPLRDEAGRVVFLIPSGNVITARKATENALRESIDKFQLLANNITDVFWIRSADMREVLYISPGFERMWGLAANSFYTNPLQWTDFIVAEDRERVRIIFDGLTRDTPSVDVEYRICRTDGEIRWVRSRGFQVRDAAGKVIRLTGIVTDITDSRQGAMALQESLDEFRSLAEAMPQIVWITRPDGWNVYLNQQWYDYTGLTPEESRGAGWIAAFHPDDQARALAAWERATATVGAYSLECRMRRADGAYRWWLIRGVPLKDANGTLLKWFGTCTDVHDLRLAELERRDADAHIREQAALLDIAHEAILVKDLDGRITFWNKGAERIYGWTAAEVIGRRDADVLDSDGEAVTAARAALMANGEWQGELRKRTKDGRQITVDVHWTLVRDDQGQPKAVLTISTDITERRTLESQLMVSDRMASVGTLAAGVAHEINNPLAAVIANIDYIIEGLASKSDPSTGRPVRNDALTLEDLRGPLADAREAAQRVRVIVRDLKVFSRSPAEESNGPVDVKATMESAVGMAWNEIRHRARLIKEYSAVPPVEANEARLCQLFLNLLVNAAQALPEGKADHSEIRIRTRLDGAHVVIEVSDTGAGIPPELIGRIFDAFYTTKAVGAGTGLGLAICQRIVTDMKGKLTVESKVGYGTTFRIALPVARREARTQTPSEVHIQGATRRGRILIVDDEALVASVIRRVLAREHDVVTVLVATEALAMCAAGERFDLILCDLMMPVMTGMDLYREMMLVAPDQAAKMIFLTGGAFTDSARAFLTDPPKEYIEKPFDSANLRAIVQRYLR